MTEFWELVERARADAATPSEAAAALVELLSPLPLTEISDFYRLHLRVTSQAHQWEVCAAAFLIWGRISDDGFSDFKDGLVALGRDAFERVVADADSLAGLSVVRAIAAGEVNRFVLAGEPMRWAAAKAYSGRTGDEEAFWDAVDALPDDTPEVVTPWSGRFGSPEDVERIPERLPRLRELFTPVIQGHVTCVKEAPANDVPARIEVDSTILVLSLPLIDNRTWVTHLSAMACAKRR